MKKIISLFLIGLILCSSGTKTRANNGVDFGRDEKAYDPDEVLKIMYGEEYSWDPIEIKTIADITNHQILEVQSDDFGEDIINGEMANLGIYKPYAGCGPIAMMGIVEYFSRLCPQLEIVKDGTSDLYEIANVVLDNTPTTTLSSNDVYTDPNDYVAAFTSIMEYYNVDNIIYAEHKGTTINDSFLESYIIPSIHKGMPITMYNAFGSVAGVSDHYCNIYGYVTYEITKKDSTEPPFEQTLLMVRVNFNEDGFKEYDFYVDPAFLNSWCTGLIGYDVLYNTKQISMGLFSEYVDENNAQFVNTPVDKVIYINNLTPIETTGLRSSYKTSCGKEYLALSSITESEDEEYIVYDPYIELNTEDYTDICAIDIKLLRLDSEDVFSTDDEILIEGYNTNTSTWETLKTISPFELETLDEIEDSYPAPSFIDAYNNIKNYRIYVDTYGIEKIRISLDAKYRNNSTNRRDIAIVSLDVHLDNENEPPYVHIHDYTMAYNYIDSPTFSAHYAYCSCGEKSLFPHQETIVDGSTVCELCGYVIEAHEHSYTLQQKDNNVHIYVCDCGRINEEAHTIEGSPVGHTTTICTICEDTIILNHIYGYHYDTPTETTHKTYCICGDFQTVSHEYTEIEYEDDSYHTKYCICGAYIVEEHDYTHNYLKNSSLNHKSYCACGDYILQSHAISPSDIGMNFANCMFCLCLLDLRNDFGEIEPTNISVDILTSDNGSYILPSGIIVLVDKDIIAYMNGTLVFRKDEDNEIM